MKIFVDESVWFHWSTQPTGEDIGVQIDVPAELADRWRRVEHEHRLVEAEIAQEVERQWGTEI